MTPETAAPRRELGDWLAEHGRLDAAQLEQLRRHQRATGQPAVRALVELGLLAEEEAARALAAQLGLEFVDVRDREFGRAELEAVPQALVLNYRMLPLAADAEQVTVAVAEPPRPAELANLRQLLQRRVRLAIATPSAVQAVIRQRFGLGAETVHRLREDHGGDASPDTVFDVAAGDGAAVEATIAALVDQLLAEALRLRATDIHLEPYYAEVRLRYRVDGLLQAVPVPPALRELHGAVVSRLKIMAGLNIAERRLPQDGRISMKTGADEYDLRVSVIPTKHGEAVCLRVLGRQSLLLDLAQLGLEPDQEALLRELTQLPQGLVLLTGPTGSGKTTTLYGALSHANDTGRKIITIEDPVEYQLAGISQIQVREDVGLTFSAGLRSVLRHDPDVVLIGEIRDAETAEIAVRAALTGHLVLSTLHTNDSVSAVTRLLEMKIEPFLVGSSLVCSIAQRLAQRLCPHCRTPDAHLAEPLRLELAGALSLPPEEVRSFHGRGCPECGGRGIRGRVAIYEFFTVSDVVADLIRPGVRTGELREAARREGWRPLRDAGWAKVQAGLIPVTEQRRLTHRLHAARAA
jgi:type II secretory ATPase GspE/PulE/Tfp pilus assembly ATPase PilB-like protein